MGGGRYRSYVGNEGILEENGTYCILGDYTEAAN